MAKKQYARIVDGAAVDVCEDPKNMFHPDIAAQFVEVPLSVKHGHRLNDGKWSAPEEVKAQGAVNEYKTMSVPDFKLLFKLAERAAIQQHRTDNAMVAAFWDYVDDQRITEININEDDVQDGITESLNSVYGIGNADERIAEVLAKAAK